MWNEEVVVLDFETTGMSADSARVIEVGAAKVVKGEIVDTFCSFCNPGEPIPYFITSLTGITSAMVKDAPPPENVMEEFHSFIGERPLLAHNASFDRRFLKAEMRRIGVGIENPFLCTMLLSRRLLQHAPDHKLGTLRGLVGFKGEADHKAHRALDDVKVTVALWRYLLERLQELSGVDSPDLPLMEKVSKMPKHLVEERLMAMGA